MASMSVKNRVAMFEHGGNNSEDDGRSPMSPTGRSITRPATPDSQSFKKPTTPSGNSFMRPATPTRQSFSKPLASTGQSFNRPTTPSGKPLDWKTAHNESPKANRNSWPWPSEESVIPAPNRDLAPDSKRRYSSPFSPQSNTPVVLPQKSPKGRSSLNSSPSPDVKTSPLKHIQNKEEPKSPLFTQKPDFTAQLQHSRQISAASGAIKTKELARSRESSPVTALSKSGSRDENRAPRVSDVVTHRNKALQLAKTRNILASSTRKSPLPTHKKSGEKSSAVEDVGNDDYSASSSHSSRMDKELSNINGRNVPEGRREITPLPSRNKSLGSLSSLPGPRKSLDSKSVGTEESLTVVSAPGEKPFARVYSRVGRLSQTQKRAGTLESAHEIEEADVPLQRSRSQSPMQALRGTRTVSKVSHQEARKALLQAAQRKKEKTDATKQHQEQQLAVVQTEELNALDENAVVSHRTTSDAADRLALKAANVLAIKNSSKLLFGSITTKADDPEELSRNSRDAEGSVSGSVVSMSSADKRRSLHPAFAARSSPKVPIQVDRPQPDRIPAKLVTKEDKPAKPFSEELFSSFRHFNNVSRPEKSLTNNKTTDGNRGKFF